MYCVSFVSWCVAADCRGQGRVMLTDGRREEFRNFFAHVLEQPIFFFCLQACVFIKVLTEGFFSHTYF